MQQLVADLRAALSARIDALDWMTPQTKSRAHEKLTMFTPKDRLPGQVEGLLGARDPPRRSHRQRAAARPSGTGTIRSRASTSRSIAPSGKMTPQEINAYYNPSNNEIVFRRRSCNRRSSTPTPIPR